MPDTPEVIGARLLAAVPTGRKGEWGWRALSRKLAAHGVQISDQRLSDYHHGHGPEDLAAWNIEAVNVLCHLYGVALEDISPGLAAIQEQRSTGLAYKPSLRVPRTGTDRFAPHLRLVS